MAAKKDLQQLFNEFIFECEYVRKLRPETLRGYRETFKLFIKLIPDLEPELITSVTLARFFTILQRRQRVVGKGNIKTGIKRSTVATYWTKLNAFFNWLKIKGHIAKNPFSEMRYPTPNYDDKKFLKKEEIERIITAIILHSSQNILVLKRNLLIFHVLLFCGLRKEELMELQLKDIDIERKILTVQKETSKSGRSRQLPLHSQIMPYLKDYLHERKGYKTAYLFVSSTRDDRLTYDGLKHLINKLKYHSGVQFHLHQLRHTFAVNFLKASNNLAKLKQLLGHTDIKMTALYLRCLPVHEMQPDIENMSIDFFI